MPWKKDDDGNLVIENGNPVYEFDSGDLVPIDFDKERQKIADLNSKAQNRANRIKAFENTIKLLNDAGIDTSDPNGVNKFIDGLKSSAQRNGNDGKTKTLEERIKHLEEYNKNLSNSLKTQKKNRAFDAIKQTFLNSEFVKTRTAFPDPEVAYNYLKDDYFKVDESNEYKPYAVNAEGEKIWVDDREATLDEAIEIIIKSHPKASRFLQVDGGGAGTRPSRGGDPPKPQKTIDRGDNKAFIDNLEAIAEGKVSVE